MNISKKHYRLLAEITLILVVIFSVRLWVQRDVISGLAPNISAIMLNGQYFDLYKEKRKPILVHFWATWCSVCKLEQSGIENLAKDFPIITIAIQSGNNKELHQFMQEENLSFKVINDESGIFSQRYNIRGVPASFIINKNNEIEFIEIGYTTELGLRIRLWWAG